MPFIESVLNPTQAKRIVMSEPISPTAANTGRPLTSRRTIMVAVDGSDHSKYAFKWSLENIIRAGGEDWVLLVTSKGGDVKGAAYAELDLNDNIGEKKNEELEKAVCLLF